MKRLPFAAAALAGMLMTVSYPAPARAQSASETIVQTGHYNGNKYTSVTYSVYDSYYTITFHYEDRTQFTLVTTDAAMFFGAWSISREASGGGIGD